MNMCVFQLHMLKTLIFIILCVSQSFLTVDPVIYALSDFTRFSRVYKDALPHVSFNSREVGSFVALKILSQQLDATMSRPHEYANKTSFNSGLVLPYQPPNKSKRPPLPVFLLPRSVSCDLPGNLNYFCSRLPVIPQEAISYLTNALTAHEPYSRSQPRNRTCELKVNK